mgnify:FL=1
MANCERKDPPVFTEEVQKWDKETVADGDAMGLVIEQLFNNTVFNRRTAEKAAGSLITGITIPASGWKDLTYTIENAAIQADSIVHIGYAFDSVPAAQKANIRGRTEAGKLILVAKKVPAGDLAVDEILIQNLKGGV